MSKKYDAAWENALTVVQEAQPPFIPEGARCHDRCHRLPAGKRGRTRHTGTRAARRSATCWKAKCCSNWKDSRRESSAPEKLSGNLAATSSTTRTATTATTSRCRFVVTMLCVPGQPMLTLVDEEELAARRHLRVPAESDTPKTLAKE